jgi:hypothetical protein
MENDFSKIKEILGSLFRVQIYIANVCGNTPKAIKIKRRSVYSQ